MKKYLQDYWPVLLAIVIFSFICYKLSFIQDDAYISYRYIANFLNSDGLVYNIGERIEGFTNFGWVVYLILWGALGLNYIFISQLTGFLFGTGVIIVTYLIALIVFDKNRLLSGISILLVAFNLSLAHWSPAGLETAAFGFFALLSVYLFIQRSWWLIFSILMVVWIRPDGVIIAGLLILIESILTKKIPKFTIACSAVAFVLSLPFVAFKYSYYGSIIPNPFYAKTGLYFEQVVSGVEYTGLFLKDYGFLGAGLLICLFVYKKLSMNQRTLFWFSILFSLYIVLIGGDVLKVHRFFVPLFGPMAILSTISLFELPAVYLICFVLIGRHYFLSEILSSNIHQGFAIVLIIILWKLSKNLRVSSRRLGTMLIGLLMIAWTTYVPFDFVNRYNGFERGFTRKMQTKAIYMKETDSTNFSVALPTIGIFGYELMGHRVIDMLGLTDSTIAKHSEEPIEGMQTTWKEVKHNSAYLLSSNLDYIIFSTDLKPSAPAERALLLYPQFLHGYRTIGWFYKTDPAKTEGTLIVAYKRMQEIKGPFVPTYPVQWVEYYKQGLDAYSKRQMKDAVNLLEKSLQASPKPYYPYAIYQMAYCNMQIGNHDKAIRLNEAVLQIDSSVYESHKDLYIYARFVGDTAKANLHQRWLEKLVPWYFPRLKATVEQSLAQSNSKLK